MDLGVRWYHCKWQHSREWSSRMPSSIGVRHCPEALSTLREPTWKSRCHSWWTWLTSKARFSCGTNSPASESLGAVSAAAP